MATVWPHRNRVAVRFKINGKIYSTTIEQRTTKTGLQAAQRLAKQAEHELRAGADWETVRANLRGEQRRISVGTLGYYAQHFLDHAQVERSTLMGYQTAYNRYWAPFDGRPIDSLVRTELAAHLAAFSVGAKTRHNALSVLRRIFEVAKNDRALDAAPTDRWRISKGSVDDPDPYSELERDALLGAMDGIALGYFSLAFHTGMRTGELLGLEWSQMEKPYIQVAQTRVRRRIKATTKTGDTRRVLVPELVWTSLGVLPSRFKKTFVFLTPTGLPFLDADWLMERWAKAHTVAGVRQRIALYPWRHTYISLALASGASLIWVSKQTGHDIVTMSRHYARWIQGREEADRNELEKVYRSTNKSTKVGEGA